MPAPAALSAPTSDPVDPTARLLRALEDLTDHLEAARRSMDLLLAAIPPRDPAAPEASAVRAPGAPAVPGPGTDVEVPAALEAHLRRPVPESHGSQDRRSSGV